MQPARQVAAEQKNESAHACGPLRRYSRQKSPNRVGAAFEV